MERNKLRSIRDFAENLEDYLIPLLESEYDKEIACSALVTTFCYWMKDMGYSSDDAKGTIQRGYDQFLEMDEDDE